MVDLRAGACAPGKEDLKTTVAIVGRAHRREVAVRGKNGKRGDLATNQRRRHVGHDVETAQNVATALGELGDAGVHKPRLSIQARFTTEKLNAAIWIHALGVGGGPEGGARAALIECGVAVDGARLAPRERQQ